MEINKILACHFLFNLIDQDSASPPEATEQKGDLLIYDLWQNKTDRVHNMRVVTLTPIHTQ